MNWYVSFCFYLTLNLLKPWGIKSWKLILWKYQIKTIFAHLIGINLQMSHFMFVNSFNWCSSKKVYLQFWFNKSDLKLQKLWLWFLWFIHFMGLECINSKSLVNVSDLIESFFNLELNLYTFKWFKNDFNLISFEEFIFGV